MLNGLTRPSKIADFQRDGHDAAVGDDVADPHGHRILQNQAHVPDPAQHLQDKGAGTIRKLPLLIAA